MPAPVDDLKCLDSCGSNSTATGLLEAAKRMDPEAWKELLERYTWLVFQWCRTAGLNPDDAADVVQTVMAHVAISLTRHWRASHAPSCQPLSAQ